MLIPPIFGVLGLVMAYVIYGMVMKYPGGEDKVAKIGEQIHIGAMVFMKREYQMLSIFAGVLIVVLWVLLGWKTAFAFIVGALASGTAGYIGMFTATKANVRTTTAAHTKGAAEALTVAFFGGSIMGLAVASLGLFGLGILYLVFGGDPATAHAIEGFGMGASSVALFARVGGGIFTKSWSARSRRASPRTTPATRASSRTTSATTSATWPAWAPTSSSPTAAR
jgi:K(+)-stimulated pyrophosphate-energized sodium pump